MKKIALGLLLLAGFIAKAQVYNNEWIDYSKTYYKFKVGKTALYRISQSVLSSAGLAGTPAEYFQLWRNGKQVPIYTSVISGTLPAAGYIEFWGEMNDGKPDRELYRDPSWQLNDKWSLETDTAAYFLTVNTDVTANLRLQTTANNVAGTSLPVEPYFMYTTGKYYRDRINNGYAVNVGDYLYSSSYDKGEGWSSNDIVTTFNADCVPTYGKLSFVFPNLNVYKAGPAPAPKFKIAVSGNLISPRRYLAKINSDSVIGNPLDFFSYTIDSTEFSINSLNSVSDTVTVFNYSYSSASSCSPVDRMVVHKYEITYPRKFNFGGQTSFEFSLAASATGNYLQITNFSYGGSPAPILYDLTNGKRYVADLSSAPTLKFVLEPSLTDRNLVLVSQFSTHINSITSLQQRNFIDYTAPANQGDYLIITNPILFAGANGSNPVDEYKTYRSSAVGGGYNAKIYLAEEIIDQFGFGIKKNPAAIRDFLRYARNNYAIRPKHVFIIGRGMHYLHQRSFESVADAEKLNLVPTFGWPGSDVLLTAEPGSSLSTLSIGRLSAVNAEEVAIYLKKVKDFEQMQALQSPLIKDKAWMKNVVHIIGASDEALDNVLSQDMNQYEKIISDTLFGGKVSTFNKTSSDAIAQLNNTRIYDLFEEGINIITYFGHSSSSALEFSLDNPENYSNYKKYPLFIALGCNVGNFFNYSALRLHTKETLSESYNLTRDKGTIGFIASTHFGIVHYLDIWAERAYQELGYKNYGRTIGEILEATARDVFDYTTEDDFYARCNVEQTEYHGDPAIRINPHAKPDYVIEDSMVRINPGFVSVADTVFKVTANILNIGRSPDSNIVVEVKRQLPNRPDLIVVQRDTIPGIKYSTSIEVDVHINPTTDKGLNKIIVTVDADNTVDELFENNNSITKDVMIYEDEARPIYPYNFAIVNNQNIKFLASTANPFSVRKQYMMELDTTEQFNSPLKLTTTLDSSGGVMEFNPGVTFTDSTVYYWRVAPAVASGSPSWNASSFIYLPNSDEGFNQSHFYQQLKAKGDNISLDSTSRQWKYESRLNNLFIRQGSWVTSGAVTEAGLSVSVNGEASIRLTCFFQSLVFNVFDPVTFKPMENDVVVPANAPGYPLGLGLYGSHANICGSTAERFYNFEYRYTDSATRRKAMNFMRNVIPDGSYVVVRSFTLDPASFPTFPQAFISDWLSDQSIYGPGEDLYHYLKNAGLSSMDSFYRARPFALVYKKNDPSFTPRWIMGEGIYDNPTLSVDCPTPDTTGAIISPVFGPAKAWKQLRWKGTTMDVLDGDNPRIDVIGIRKDGLADTLIRNITPEEPTTDVSFINAATYPFVQLYMHNADSVHITPYQLDYWRLTYSPAPEGALNAGQYFSITDTVEVGQPLQFKIPFKNVTAIPFDDSMKVKVVVTDRTNRTHEFKVKKLRVLNVSPDTLMVNYPIDTRELTGANTLYVELNPDNDQPEQYHFNNFFYSNVYVRGDSINPLLDVTFDNIHILNHDIVSSKPNIIIKLRDEAKWFPIDDPSALKIQVRYPDGSLRPYSYNSDTLQFTPADQKVPITNNTATAIFKPYFPEDGEYELIVTGKDMSQNNAGPMEYRVAFEVINKPMISNMLNYPNPFTTSTAFVFTLTGSEVPQNIRIQILTVTGKVVREITKDELGPLHIGRNITEFKWDGTDQYGQKLANGVYLYRVITNLNGKSLDKYTSKQDNTDQYFNKGYGKMYLMR